eukprot:6176355-Pleurochrysis_carterae.AAC.1
MASTQRLLYGPNPPLAPHECDKPQRVGSHDRTLSPSMQRHRQRSARARLNAAPLRTRGGGSGINSSPGALERRGRPKCRRCAHAFAFTEPRRTQGRPRAKLAHHVPMANEARKCAHTPRKKPDSNASAHRLHARCQRRPSRPVRSSQMMLAYKFARRRVPCPAHKRSSRPLLAHASLKRVGRLRGSALPKTQRGRQQRVHQRTHSTPEHVHVARVRSQQAKRATSQFGRMHDGRGICRHCKRRNGGCTS